MASGDIYRLAVVGKGPQNQELVNTFHYQEGAFGVFVDPGAALVQSFEDNTEAFFVGPLSTQCSVVAYSVRGITVPTYGYDKILETPVPGGSSGQTVAPMNSVVISWRTGLIGRSYRGRSYLWPITESQTDAGVVSSAILTDVGVLVDKLMFLPATLFGPAFNLVLWSPTRSDFNLITSGIVRPDLCTQRRRKSGVGA